MGLISCHIDQCFSTASPQLLSCRSVKHISILYLNSKEGLPGARYTFIQQLAEGYNSIDICIELHIYPITRKRSMRYTISLRSCQPPVYHTKMGNTAKRLSQRHKQVNLPACSPHCPFNAERQAVKL